MSLSLRFVLPPLPVLAVNPDDADQCGAALALALTMPASEQRERRRRMRGLDAEFNVFHRAGRPPLDAAAMRRHRRPERTAGGVG